MGNMQALAYSEAIKEGWATLETALVCHLQSNHYPPISTVFVPVAIEAISHGTGGDWSHVIHLPNGMDKSVADIVEGLNLGAFIGIEDEED